MKKILSGIMIALLFSSIYTPVMATDTITVIMKNFRSNKGKAMVAIFASADGFPAQPDKAIAKSIGSIKDKQAKVEFTNIPPGLYAISVLHDENDNDKLDTGLFGIPTEGLGASKNAKGNFGPPAFNDASFQTSSGNAIATINMQYIF